MLLRVGSTFRAGYAEATVNRHRLSFWMSGAPLIGGGG